ncbi:MAG: carboxyltransferase domain-containing protein [Sulfuritalea sp.]|nr:carboxyltransferase domain-containing protein [Sulfuritalea sp.]
MAGPAAPHHAAHGRPRQQPRHRRRPGRDLPWQSPGGWHLLGRTPLTLFDPANAQRPARFAPGDVLHIEAVTPDEFENLRDHPRHA